MPLRSMTGHGGAVVSLGPHGDIHLELSAVNHRYLQLHLRAETLSRSQSAALEAKLRPRLQRGYVTLKLHWRRPESRAKAVFNLEA
ncbi:MAG: YicC/YloC family endoribonuclease, partial [Polyangiales bacterium]